MKWPITVSKREIDHYQRIVRRFEEVARATMGTSASIGHLCRTAGLNQRTLLRAMRKIHGATPCQYLRGLRLIEARQILLSKEVPAPSVTEVALRCGFRELGRFAVDYRLKFGESPSDTLRHASTRGLAQPLVVCPER